MLGIEMAGAAGRTGAAKAQDADEDIFLLQRVAQGDQEALLRLHKRYANLVYSMAWRVLQDAGRAEEVTQDIFLKLWQKGQRYDPARGRFSTWLLSVTRFAAIDLLRREGRRPRETDLDRDDGEAAPALERLFPTDHAAWERGQHLRMLLVHLPDEQRHIIELAFYGGMTHTELADHLQLPLGTVKGRLRLGIEKLRVLWMDEIGVRK